MNKCIAACATLALGLVGCATGGSGPKGFAPFDVAASNVVHVSVKVMADEYIIVGQDPVLVTQGTENTIFWHLDPAGAYVFADSGPHKGIKFAPPGPGGHRCDRDATDAKTYSCTYRRVTPKSKFQYAIEVTKDGTSFLQSDPTVVNN